MKLVDLNSASSSPAISWLRRIKITATRHFPIADAAYAVVSGEHALVRSSSLAYDLAYEGSSGCGVEPMAETRRDFSSITEQRRALTDFSGDYC